MGRDGGSSSRRKHKNYSSSDDEDDRRKRKKTSSKQITEQEINEYLAKKAQKKAMKVAKKLKTETVSGYANDSNPFGDSNLNEKLVWKKKIEKSISQGESIDEISVKSEKRRIKERMAEIEKVKKRREERAIEKAQHEEEMASLKEIHTKLLRKHLRRLQNPVKSENILEDERDDPKPQAEEDITHDMEDAGSYSPKLIVKEEVNEEEEAGSFSPELMHDDENEEAIDPDEDRNELERRRQAVKEEHKRRVREAMASKPAPVDDNWELKANRVMGDVVDGDAVFGSGAEVNLDSQVYWWHDKYRPRKPKYFNRVHTGYEWNKYNQTHYDHDNPPPKTVQGYKFNIFYPDLVDKTKAPTFTIEKVEGSNGETCLISFHAGPPYEDIAFKIVNKEWEYSHKKGFKCTFERGILHVYFNFQRYRYRR